MRRNDARTALQGLLAAALLLAACLVAGCAQSEPLPADFPLAPDILPADAFIHVAYSSQNPDGQQLDYSKADVPGGQSKQVQDILKTHWNIVFTSKRSEAVCRENLEGWLKKKHYRYADRDAPENNEFEAQQVRFYFSPKDNLAVALMYSAARSMFCLLVIKNDQFDKNNYNAARALD
jgi:hypothetical protein